MGCLWVGGVDRMTAGDGGAREAVVAAGVLGDAMDDLEHAQVEPA